MNSSDPTFPSIEIPNTVNVDASSIFTRQDIINQLKARLNDVNSIADMHVFFDRLDIDLGSDRLANNLLKLITNSEERLTAKEQLEMKVNIKQMYKYVKKCALDFRKLIKVQKMDADYLYHIFLTQKNRLSTLETLLNLLAAKFNADYGHTIDIPASVFDVPYFNQ